MLLLGVLFVGGVLGMVRNAGPRPPRQRKAPQTPDSQPSLFIDHTLVDPVMQAEIMARCQAMPVKDDPQESANDLGLLSLPDKTEVRVWLVHAADSVLLDEHDQVLLITRLNNPGRGKLALPGGLLDQTPNGMETSLKAALREASEETGIDPALLAKATITKLGSRRKTRPFDIRRAWSKLEGTPVCLGDIFTVSTLGFCVRLPGNLRDIELHAADDATALTILPAREVKLESLAVPDHLELIHAALAS